MASAVSSASVRAGAAVRLFPDYTQARIRLLTAAETPAEMDSQADEILRRNRSVAVAWDAKARAAYAAGDFTTVIAHKQEALRLAPYELSEYLDYFDMLWVGMQLYEKNGDLQSRNYCAARLLELPELLQAVEARTSSLGRRIQDKPELSLPENYRQALEALAQLLGGDR